MRVFFVLAAFFVSVAHADTLYVHGLTAHYVECSDPCNETNVGISYKHHQGDRFWHVGAFENSQYNPAAFAAYGWSRDWHGIELGAAAGLAVGYVDKIGVTDAGIAPALLLSAEYGAVYAAVLPGALTFALRYSFR